jgi:hypothetical protein
MGLPTDATEHTFDLIVSSARALGLLREIKGDEYVHLDAVTSADTVDPPAPDEADELEDPPGDEPPVPPSAHTAAPRRTNSRRIARSSSRTERTRRSLSSLRSFSPFGEFEPVVSVERDSISKPVPTKVLDDMRSCSAAERYERLRVAVRIMSGWLYSDSSLLDQSGGQRRA